MLIDIGWISKLLSTMTATLLCLFRHSFISNWCRNTEYRLHCLNKRLRLDYLHKVRLWKISETDDFCNWFWQKMYMNNSFSCPQASPTGPSRSRHSIIRPTEKPPPVPAYTPHKQSLQHSEPSQPSPSVPPKRRPLPPNRPPPPRPMTKPAQTAEVSVFLSWCVLLSKCRSNPGLVTPTCHSNAVTPTSHFCLK